MPPVLPAIGSWPPTSRSKGTDRRNPSRRLDWISLGALRYVVRTICASRAKATTGALDLSHASRSAPWAIVGPRRLGWLGLAVLGLVRWVRLGPCRLRCGQVGEVLAVEHLGLQRVPERLDLG